ncbi:MAG: LysM peptidoglycan-binding domain-containing protein [Ilumatobacteraceae bacterium]
MGGVRVAVWCVTAVCGGFLGAGCGGEGGDSATLPPIATTTTTTSTVPTTTTVVYQYYTVRSGDTLSEIAMSFGVFVKDLMDVNGITDADLIQEGSLLKIPPPPVIITALPVATTSTTPSTSG